MKHNVSSPLFDGVRRLYGDPFFQVISRSHILVVGLGGVGSWVVEALARTGIGEMTLVDFDDVCRSNTNRQVQAVSKNVGRPKVMALKDRVFEINPDCKINMIQDFYSKDLEETLFSHKFSGVVDCIDRTLNKEQLALACKARSIPLVVVGGAGGLMDPSRITASDLSRTMEDGMLSNMRKSLRRYHNFPRGKEKFGIPAVFSSEKPTYIDEKGHPTSQRPKDLKGALDCAGGLGSSVAVTSTFAMFAVAEVLNLLKK